MTKVAVTCGHLQRDIELFRADLETHGLEVVLPEVPGQELAGQALVEAMQGIAGVIAGDDQFSADVMSQLPDLKIISKWGIGLDGVDQPAAADLGIKVTNTPGMFGDEVAEQALGYLIGLVRGQFSVDRAVRKGGWPKPVGRSLLPPPNGAPSATFSTASSATWSRTSTSWRSRAHSTSTHAASSTPNSLRLCNREAGSSTWAEAPWPASTPSPRRCPRVNSPVQPSTCTKKSPLAITCSPRSTT